MVCCHIKLAHAQSNVTSLTVYMIMSGVQPTDTVVTKLPDVHSNITVVVRASLNKFDWFNVTIVDHKITAKLFLHTLNSDY